MSKSNAIAIILPAESQDAEQLEQFLLALSGRENVHRRLALLCQAAQGACLKSLQALYGFTRGGDRKSGQPIKTTKCGFDSWADLVEKKFGFSDEKARRLMAVCDGMAPHLKKLTPKERERLGEFLGRPMLHLTEPEIAVLEKITHKITDADTQTAFLQECGYLKKPHGHGLKDAQRGGGAKDGDEPAVPVAPQQLFFDEIYLRLVGGGDGTTKTVWEQFDEVIKSWNKKLPLGNSKLPLWQHGDRAKLKALVAKVKHEKAVVDCKFADLIKQAEEALSGK